MSAELAHLILQESPDAALLISADGAVRHWSPGAESVFGCGEAAADRGQEVRAVRTGLRPPPVSRRTVIAALLAGALAAAAAEPQPVGPLLARAAARQIGVTTLYDPSYVRLRYPNGDVPLERGVCADVVVRAFREIGVDLQREIHEDMRRSFRAYPRHWGLSAPDRNIDHRRVPNLMRYFERRGKGLSTAAAYEPGDVVAWRLPNGLYHIGIVAADQVPGAHRSYVVHNIGAGARQEDILYSFVIIGHYRW